MRDEFGIDQFVMVGDRGMLTQKQVDELRGIDGVDWIGALRPEAIKKLATNGAIQMGLFDERNLFELKHPDFPGERLVACRNIELAHRREIKRENLLKATVKELDKVRGMVRRGRLRGKNEIKARVRGILKKYKIGKHFELDIRDDGFNYKVNENALISEIMAKYKGNQELIEKRLKRSRSHIESHRKTICKAHPKDRQRQSAWTRRDWCTCRKSYQQIQGWEAFRTRHS